MVSDCLQMPHFQMCWGRAVPGCFWPMTEYGHFGRAGALRVRLRSGTPVAGWDFHRAALWSALSPSLPLWASPDIGVWSPSLPLSPPLLLHRPCIRDISSIRFSLGV